MLPICFLLEKAPPSVESTIHGSTIKLCRKCKRTYPKGNLMHLFLAELSPVQQQLSDINNRYSLLGTKLTDRHSELDALREELRRHLDSCRQLNQFLDKVKHFLGLFEHDHRVHPNPTFRREIWDVKCK